jgi:hypothetical protein
MRRLNCSVMFPILIVFALLGYFLPWVLTPAISLNLGAYDLAEWSSLHPIVRQTTPFLWTSLVLRIPLAIVGILFAAYIGKTFRRASIAILCLLIAAIALLPPLEFFTIYRDDPNYRQQFFLGLITPIIGIIIIGESSKLQRLTLIALSILGVLTSVLGLYQALGLLQSFGLPITVGSGGVITCVSLAVLAYGIYNKTE